MAMIRCDADEHYFDSNKHSECPFCRKTRRLDVPASDDNNVTGGEIARNENAHTKHYPVRDTKPMLDQDNNKTKILFKPSAGKDNPSVSGAEDASWVVGWLVVTDGPGVGQDRRICVGKNKIGRDQSADIVLDFGDGSLSRTAHAVVVYDPNDNDFILLDGDSRNLTYHNGKKVMMPTPLVSGDRIKLGETELMFIALCGEHFQW